MLCHNVFQAQLLHRNETYVVSTRRFHTIKIQAFSMGSIAKLRNAVKCKANSFMASPGISIYHQWSQTLLQHCSPGHHWLPHAIPHAMPHVMPHALPMPHPMAPAMPGEIHPFQRWVCFHLGNLCGFFCAALYFHNSWPENINGEHHLRSDQ